MGEGRDSAKYAEHMMKGFQDGFADNLAGADLASVQRTKLWAEASDQYREGWGKGYERAASLPYLTLGEFRRATSHLPDETPITAGGITDQNPADWLNVGLEHVPEQFPYGDETSIILGLKDDFDTRQW
jgi:hypothetical protein